MMAEKGKRIVVTGGTGLIGSRLSELLAADYQLTVLTRSTHMISNNPSIKYVSWNGESSLASILEGAYGIINLGGENIGSKAWTKQQKEKIINSRLDLAQHLASCLVALKERPQVWIQASATGYYGIDKNQIFDESSPLGTGFLAQVCEAWEGVLQKVEVAGLRKIFIRTGLVLSPAAELWKQLTLTLPFRFAVVAGSGKQKLPWIHIDDELRAIIFLLENQDCQGSFNLVAPRACTMQDLVQTIGLHKPIYFNIHISKMLLGLVLGKEKTRELILVDQEIKPTRLLEAGFKFGCQNIGEGVKRCFI
ncbi:NAD-dependent nucleotide-sugar epimerase [Bacteroidales bacterium]|nr:NAD-dependent nucleotide-sugar epimerase [Bacteroidales bacterium]